MTRISASDLRDRLAELFGTSDVPGAAVSVLAAGEVTDAVIGVVNARTGVEVRPDSPFMIQSVTKVWTATLVMQLVDEGLVDLDDPVRRHLPGFRTGDPAVSAAITVRHLLTHTGGFEGDIWAPTTGDEHALRLFVDDLVSRAPQHAEPGSMFSYCSAGLGVLGRLVEVLRETTYAGALRRHLVDPLGLTGVATDAGEALGHRTAIGHVRPTAGEALRPLPTWAVLPPSNPAAGNQLAMPASDLIRFAGMHLSDGRTPDGAGLLSTESARLMRQPMVAVPGTVGRPVHQGLGWRLTPSAGLVEHGGNSPGNEAQLVLAPEAGVAVAVLVNVDEAHGLVAELCDGLLHDLAGIAPPAAPGPVPEPRTDLDTRRYVGRYELRNEVDEVGSDADGRLWHTRWERNDAVDMATRAGARLDPDPPAELRPLGSDTFVRVDRDGNRAGTVAFVGTDGDGRARYLHNGRAAPRIGD